MDERQDGMLCETRIKLGDRTRADAEQQNEGASRRGHDTDQRKNDDAGPDQMDAPRCWIHFSNGGATEFADDSFCTNGLKGSYERTRLKKFMTTLYSQPCSS